MHDIRAIRTDPQAFDAAMARRGLAPVAATILDLDREARARQTAIQAQQTERRSLSEQVGRLRRQAADSSELEARATTLRQQIETEEAALGTIGAQLRDILAALPAILDPDVPDGPDESANRVLKQVGEPPALPFAPREHFELGEALGMMDFATAAKIAGSRFTILRGPLARMERALGQFMIDLHTTEHGYEETTVPLLVNDDSAFGTSQLPKFAEDLFHTTDGRWLIPTAEVPLTNMVAREILPEQRLPIRVTALSDCFRSEAGSAGRDTRGMLRQHQFRKAEMVSITRPEDSDAEHERMTACAEAVLERLELPYRRVLLCSGDTGFSSARTHDLEVWLPGQKAWREISSCSNIRAFQARRMDARYRTADGRVAHVHTLNGSGVAVGRALIAVMENYQREDGSIAIPSVLARYLPGLDHIGRA